MGRHLCDEWNEWNYADEIVVAYPSGNLYERCQRNELNPNVDKAVSAEYYRRRSTR